MTTMKELFDVHAEGDVIPTKSVATILKEMGLQNIKESNVLDEIDADGTHSKFHYQDLQNYYYQKLREENAVEEITAAIKQHYPTTKDETLTKQQMKDVIGKLGPQLSEDEVTEILNELDVQGNDEISISLFAECLLKF
jgi:Ca2+-binding EF-hand superfamily protein